MPRKYREVPWKRNFRQIPRNIERDLANVSSDLVLVANSKVVPPAHIESGIYGHLGLKISNGDIIADPETIPPVYMGKFSTRNVEGWEVKRTDLPKITKTYFWETPNFGDGATYGYHDHSQDREVYQREYYEPRNLAVTVEILSTEAVGDGGCIIKFAVDCVLDRTRDDFEDDLLFCVNLLQENAGTVGVFESDASRQDFLGTIELAWEIFPPGTIDEVVTRITGGSTDSTDRPRGVVEDRVKLFRKLKPIAYLRGTDSFGSYFGAQYADDLVVFENFKYGNALYVLYDDWESVSKRSRLDLLKGTTENFDRFIHKDEWKYSFENHMHNELSKRGIRIS